MGVFKGIKNFIANYDDKNKIHYRVVKMLIDNAVSIDEIEYYKRVAPILVEKKMKTCENNFCKVERYEKKNDSIFNAFDKIETYGEDIPDFCDVEEPICTSRINKREIDYDEERKKVQLDNSSLFIPGLRDDFGKGEESDLKIQITQNNKYPIELDSTTVHLKVDEAEDVFNQNIYKVINKLSMHLLQLESKPYYLFSPLQCKLCGLRYRSNSAEEFGIHIEDHRRRNRALDDKMVLQREFFTSKTPKTIIKLNLSCDDENVELIVWNKDPPTCIICNETINKYWKDNIEEWILEDGVKINEYEYGHIKCLL